MHSLIRFLNPRRLGAALAATLGIAAGFVPFTTATAGTVTLTGGTTSCTYGSFTGDTIGNFNFTCTGGSTPQQGTLALNLAGTATSLAPNGTTNFTVTRTGVTAGASTATANLSVSGGGSCLLSQSTITFTGDTSTPTPTPVTLTAGGASGFSCNVAMTATNAATGSPASHAVSIVDPNAPVSFSFSSGTSTAFFGGSAASLTVTRPGGTVGAWDVPFAIGGTLTDGTGLLLAGGGTLSPPITAGTPNSGKITFPAGSGASQTITFTPPATSPAGVTPPANLGVQLLAPVEVGAPIPGHTGSLGITTLNVMTVSVPTGCTTTATYTVPWNGGQTIASQVKQNETGAVSIMPTPQFIGADGIVSVVVSETSSTGDQADVHFTLSACPGDFTPAIGACAQHTQYTGGSMKFSIGPKPPSIPWYQPVCELPLGTTTVYLNFRQIKRPTPNPPSAPGVPSCQFTSCPIYVQFN